MGLRDRISATLSRIRELRESRGLTQGQFALLVGVDRSSVARWEDGVIPRKAMQRRIARVLLGRATAVDELGFD
jgi:transcriptional regulator with XRE-family HTH domain